MPLADLTAIANLALSHLGEPFLADYDTDTGTTADAVRLHLPQCRETVLEGHVWSFATRCSQLSAVSLVETTASATLDPSGDNNAILFTAVTPGPSGNEISVTIAAPAAQAAVGVVGTAITITPAIQARLIITGSITPSVPDLYLAGTESGWPIYTENGLNDYSAQPQCYRTGSQWVLEGIGGSWRSAEDSADTPDLAGGWTAEGSATGTPIVTASVSLASDVIASVNANASASLLVLAANGTGSDGTGVVAAVSATALTGGSSVSAVFAPAYGSAFNLPADSLRLLKIDGTDIDAPRTRFEIQGRYLLLEHSGEAAPVIHYITEEPPVDEWPTTFTDAVAFLLAARLAPLLTQSQQLADKFHARHEEALGKARSKDARETRSKENHGPRALAARSAFVNARYGRGGPAYVPGTTQVDAPSDSVSDWSGEID